MSTLRQKAWIRSHRRFNGRLSLVSGGFRKQKVLYCSFGFRKFPIGKKRKNPISYWVSTIGIRTFGNGSSTNSPSTGTAFVPGSNLRGTKPQGLPQQMPDMPPQQVGTGNQDTTKLAGNRVTRAVASIGTASLVARLAKRKGRKNNKLNLSKVVDLGYVRDDVDEIKNVKAVTIPPGREKYSLPFRGYQDIAVPLDWINLEHDRVDKALVVDLSKAADSGYVNKQKINQPDLSLVLLPEGRETYSLPFPGYEKIEVPLDWINLGHKDADKSLVVDLSKAANSGYVNKPNLSLVLLPKGEKFPLPFPGYVNIEVPLGWINFNSNNLDLALVPLDKINAEYVKRVPKQAKENLINKHPKFAKVFAKVKDKRSSEKAWYPKALAFIYLLATYPNAQIRGQSTGIGKLASGGCQIVPGEDKGWKLRCDGTGLRIRFTEKPDGTLDKISDDIEHRD